jgi:DNA-binding phage protein
MIRRFFAYALPKKEWVRMNRPMANPNDSAEKAQRRREYAGLLRVSSYAVFSGLCDPDSYTSYPAGILRWQKQERFTQPKAANECAYVHAGSSKGDQYIAEHQCDLARSLAISLVADDVGTSAEYLRKKLRHFEPTRNGNTNTISTE